MLLLIYETACGERASKALRQRVAYYPSREHHGCVNNIYAPFQILTLWGLIQVHFLRAYSSVTQR